MKNVTFIFILVFVIIISSYGQDVIIKKDSTHIQSQVLEINTSIIKYKKFSNPNGPTYEILKTDVQRIVYPNGSIDDFSKEEDQTQKQQDDQTRKQHESVVKLRKTMSTNLNKNGKTTIKLNDKDYITEFNNLTVTETYREQALFLKNHSSIYMRFSSTFITDDKKIVITFTLTQNDMKAGTFKANRSNTLDNIDRQFSTTIQFINPNMYGGIGGGNIIPINNIKIGRLIIESIDKDNKKISGTIQIIGTYVDGGKIDLLGTFSDISY